MFYGSMLEPELFGSAAQHGGTVVHGGGVFTILVADTARVDGEFQQTYLNPLMLTTVSIFLSIGRLLWICGGEFLIL